MIRIFRCLAWSALCVLIFVRFASSQTAEFRKISAALSYVSVGTVYFDAGRVLGFAVGDTVTVKNKSVLRGRALVTAVSSNSSAASILDQTSPFAVGDSVSLEKIIVREAPADGASGGSRRAGSNEPNSVTGRVAVQYVGSGSLQASRTDYSQPALLMRLDVARLLGTGVTFTMYGRAYEDLSPQVLHYDPKGSRVRIRMYEMYLQDDRPGAASGYSLGRVTSRYVGGLGVFDGGQFFLRSWGFTSGVLLGLQPDYQTSGIDKDQQKAAAFVNYAWGSDPFESGDMTVAYGQQRYRGKIDRVFMYVQTSARFSQDLMLYQSGEVDMVRMNNGIREKKPSLTNTFVSISYTPTPWLSTSLGYDATRNIYLLESDKAFSDTLLDKNLQHGVRLYGSIRPTNNLVVSATASVRLHEGDARNARNLGGGVRMSDIFNSAVNGGIQYTDIRNLYTNGQDITLDIDRWITTMVSFSLRLDRYAYRLITETSKNVSTTASLNLNCRLSRSWYAVVSADQVWDPSGTSQRVFLEAGVRF